MEVALATGGLSSESIYRLLLDELSARHVQGPILEAGAGIGLLTPQLLPYDSALTCVDLLPKPDTLPGNSCLIPETTSAEAFERYVGGKCLRAGHGKAWRDIKAWLDGFAAGGRDVAPSLGERTVPGLDHLG
jgi:hypothetical protein